MKKKTIITLLLIVFVLICFVPFNQQKTINIKAQYFLVFQQLAKPENWQNWQTDLREAVKKTPAEVKIIKADKTFEISAPEINFNVDHTEGFGFVIDKKTGDKNSICHIIAIPNNKNGTALIVLTEKRNFAQLLYRFLNESTDNADVFNLKNYMEDARLYYGFDIKRTTVTDSNIVVIKEVVAARNKLNELAQIEFELKTFIQKHQLKQVQPVIADIREAGKDSLRMMIGFPVNQQTVSAGKIQFMHLPQHGRMLTGIYNGKYSGRGKLYAAMKTYLADHNLASPEDPYEKYLDNKIPVNDSCIVRLQVNFPIY